MNIRFIGRGSYYAHPFLFTEEEREHKTTKKLGEYLLKTGLFEEVKEGVKKSKTTTQKEVEEKASKEKKKLDKSKSKKK